MEKVTLRELRENAGLSVCEVAKKIGVTRNAVYNYENGLRSIDVLLAFNLALIYKVSIDDIAEACLNVRNRSTL